MRKKIIALVLCLATILGCTTAFAWESASPVKESTYAKELLKELDIIDVVSDNGYAPDQVLTRAELADAILGLNNYRDSAAYGSCFADVDESTEYSAAIATLAGHGIIAQDVNYNPSANAKFEQAVKMIVYTLGFGEVTEAQGGWLEPILNVARESGVTKGVSVTAGTDLTADMLAVMLYNSLDSEMLKRKSLSEFETVKGETLIWKKFGIKKVKGIVTANEITTLTGDDAKAGVVSVDWTEYDDEAQVLAPYLGYEVMAYYTEDDEEIVFGYPTDRNQIMTIAADDIVPNGNGFGYETICYREPKESGSARTKKAKVEADADVIYNGKALPTYTPDDFRITSGRLVLIDSDNDSTAEVVIIEETENYVVDSINLTDMRIYDMYGAELKLEDVDKLEIYDMYGAAIEVSTLAKWNVLSVVKSRDNNYIKVVAYNDPVTGDVEKYYTEDGDTYATIDGDTFKVAASYLAAVASGNVNAKKISIGQSGTYYLDGDEKIAAVSLEVNASWQYAFLMRAQNTDDDGVRYRLLMDESGFKWYEGEEKIRIDEMKKENDDRKTYFDDANENEDKRKTVPQMVKVQLSGSGKVKKIDTIYRGSREDDESLTRVITNYATNSDNTVNMDRMYEIWSIRTGRFGLGSSVSVYVHPSTTFIVRAPNTGDIYDENRYQLWKGNFGNNEHMEYNAYDVDWAGIAKAAVVYKDTVSSSSTGGTLLFVSNVTQVLNSDDEVVRQVTGYTYDGKEVTVGVDVDFNFTADKGDIIRYETDYKSEINEVKYVFDYSAQKNFEEMTNFEYSTGDTDGANRGNSQSYINGNIIIAKNGSYIKALSEGIAFADASDNMPFSKTQMFSLADASIMLYDNVAPSSTRITKISSSELSKYLHDRNPEVKVILYSTYSQLRTVMIYL